MPNFIVSDRTYQLMMKLKKRLATNDGIVQEIYYNYILYEELAKAKIENLTLKNQLAELTTQEAVDKFIKEHTLEAKS